ncbi:MULTISPECIES: phosphopantetheine-binding protein [unclassified Streptomyces]|uniref:phosphopantetheine-binding protein n=1 Tax=unclassified Streptomyces TaxID=2593676 RepID=UPI002E0FF5E5|nr:MULTISPECIES: phosphopantetheine-binding protein [unclassified Streptomyces]WSR21626.1 phosphopantetheine-binding protein [Streptomyces sp. NBC_01205]
MHASHANPPEVDFAAVIAEIWCEVLEVPAVGNEDNFFDLGGHSLLLQLVRERVVQRTGKNVELIEFFTHPTVRSLATRLENEGAAPAADGRRRPAGRLNRLGNRRTQLGRNSSDSHGEFGE